MSELADRLTEIQRRCDAATPGPWEIYDDGWDIGVCTAGDGTPGIAYVAEKLRQGRDEGESDARFVAAAPTDLPSLLNALRAVLDLHQPMDLDDDSQVCEECVARGDWLYPDMPPEEADYSAAAWPCPTVSVVAEALGVEP